MGFGDNHRPLLFQLDCSSDEWEPAANGSHGSDGSNSGDQG